MAVERGEDHEHSGSGVGFLLISETSVRLPTVKSGIKEEDSELHRKEAD